jgi:predicted HAD superfamily Cof-like phosphohydrolase
MTISTKISYKQFMRQITINEVSLFSSAIERKLKSTGSKIKATDDVAKKIDLLADALHFAIGSLALELHQSQRDEATLLFKQ